MVYFYDSEGRITCDKNKNTVQENYILIQMDTYMQSHHQVIQKLEMRNKTEEEVCIAKYIGNNKKYM